MIHIFRTESTASTAALTRDEAIELAEAGSNWSRASLETMSDRDLAGFIDLHQSTVLIPSTLEWTRVPDEDDVSFEVRDEDYRP